MKPHRSTAFPPHSFLADVWAGGATALIFYIEYVGLGSLLGEALLPGIPDGAALGTMLVIVPVVACSLLALASHGAALSGPRAASMVVATKLLTMLVAAYPGLQGDKTLLLAVITATASLTLLFGCMGSVRHAIERAPTWLIQGFMYATALGIVAGSAAAGRLLGCMQVDKLATWLVYLPSVVLGIAWKPVLQRIHGHLARNKGFTRPAHLLLLMQPLGLLAGAATSWLIYERTRLSTPNGPFCGRFGNMQMDWSLLDARWFDISHSSNIPPTGALLLAALCGVGVGAVLLLESLTAFIVNIKLAAYSSLQPRMLCATSAGGFFAAAVGGAPASFSTSRTVVLRMLGGHGRWAVPAHGLALLAIVLLATPWMAQVPKLSAAVALTLVGVQMLGRDTEMLWKHGYRPGAVAPRQRAIVLFWLVLAVSVAANNALVGFLAMGMVAAVLFQRRNKRIEPR
ncbi:hypothetical protein ACSFA3_03685 [Variovorax sp. RHLX14]|uniref:hypothetical protein n=1 Tax=Variovorax sp. RHLX14 TaxID=1259731 RepID=UPI003F46A084